MLKRMTSFTMHRTGEGIRISYTYSEIDESGNVVRGNLRKDIIAVRSDIVTSLENVETFINERLASEV